MVVTIVHWTAVMAAQQSITKLITARMRVHDPLTSAVDRPTVYLDGSVGKQLE